MNESERESLEARWERRYAELEVYVRIHGHARIARTDAVHSRLSRWLKTQQSMAVAGTLTVERWWRLRELGIDLQGLDERWERRLDQLREFRRRFGHCRVPNKWKEDIAFGHWVHTQRAFKKRGRLSAMRIALLEAIGFEWHDRWEASADEHWERMYTELARYRQMHDDAEVPPSFREVRGLGQWVLNQREASNQGVLRPDRRDRLEAIGFAWKATRRADNERWERRLAQFVEFRKRFGHCHVPNKWKEDIAFGHWVHAQRAFKSRGALSPERIERLEAAGFEWHGPHSRSYLYDDRWAQMFALLAEYQKQHGDTQVPPSFRALNGLGGWVSKQREAYRNGTLPQDRREQLEALGFEWRGVRKGDADRWERRFQQLLAYRQRHGNCRVPNKWNEGLPFGHWVHNQRAFKKAGRLSPERIRRLEEIGFQWSG